MRRRIRRIKGRLRRAKLSAEELRGARSLDVRGVKGAAHAEGPIRVRGGEHGYGNAAGGSQGHQTSAARA
jgi:hypothetical protein